MGICAEPSFRQSTEVSDKNIEGVLCNATFNKPKQEAMVSELRDDWRPGGSKSAIAVDKSQILGDKW
jgi:hypothetical protein